MMMMMMVIMIIIIIVPRRDGIRAVLGRLYVASTLCVVNNYNSCAGYGVGTRCACGQDGGACCSAKSSWVPRRHSLYIACSRIYVYVIIRRTRTTSIRARTHTHIYIYTYTHYINIAWVRVCESVSACVRFSTWARARAKSMRYDLRPGACDRINKTARAGPPDILLALSVPVAGAVGPKVRRRRRHVLYVLYM